MMRKLNIIMVLIALAKILNGQEEDKLNSVFIEVGGIGGFYSFNYDRTIPINDHWGIKLGLGVSPQTTWGFLFRQYMPSLPFHARGYYKFNKKHLMDFGISAAPVYGNNVYFYGEEYTIWAQAQVGYKYYLKNKKLYLGASVNLVFYDYGITTTPWAGIVVGYRFDKIERMTISKKEKEKHILQNFSGTIGFLSSKIRLQYERAWGSRLSFGSELTYYLRKTEFPGPKIELFARCYSTKHGNTEGFFLQGKVGVGYVHSGLYTPDEKKTWGYTFGAGAAGG